MEYGVTETLFPSVFGGSVGTGIWDVGELGATAEGEDPGSC